MIILIISISNTLTSSPSFSFFCFSSRRTSCRSLFYFLTPFLFLFSLIFSTFLFFLLFLLFFSLLFSLSSFPPPSLFLSPSCFFVHPSMIETLSSHPSHFFTLSQLMTLISFTTSFAPLPLSPSIYKFCLTSPLLASSPICITPHLFSTGHYGTLESPLRCVP